MQRDALLPLHGLPILISTTNDEYEGFVGVNPVRVLKGTPTVPQMKKLIGNEAANVILWAQNSMQAYNRRDAKRLKEAYEHLARGLVMEPRKESPEETILFVSRPDLEKQLAQLGAGLPDAAGKYFLPWLMNPRLSDVRLVLWWQKGSAKLSAGLFCPDYTSAILAKLLLGELGFRKCLHCGKIFRLRADYPEQDYCKPAHREARRVARWREKQKEEKR